MNDQAVLREMFSRAEVKYRFDPAWNAIVVEPKAARSPDVYFLFDKDGRLYSLPDEKVEEFKAWFKDE